MSSIEHRTAFIRAAAGLPKARPRRLRAVLGTFMMQYTIVAIMVCLTGFYIVRYMVTPQIVAKFELMVAALKR